MPTGVHVNKETKERIMELKAQGLSYKVIAIRTGLHHHTINRIYHRLKKETP